MSIGVNKNYRDALGYIGLGLQAVGGGIQTGSYYGSGIASSNYYKGVSDSLLNQVKMNRATTANQLNYDAQNTAYRIRSVMSKGEQLFGRQKTTLARMGDTTGNSARALVKSSAIKQAEDIAMLEYQNELASFEKQRQMELENISLETQAKFNRLAGQSAEASGTINAVASFINTLGTVAGSWYSMAGTGPVSYIGAGRTTNSNYGFSNGRIVYNG